MLQLESSRGEHLLVQVRIDCKQQQSMQAFHSVRVAGHCLSDSVCIYAVVSANVSNIFSGLMLVATRTTKGGEHAGYS